MLWWRSVYTSKMNTFLFKAFNKKKKVKETKKNLKKIFFSFYVAPNIVKYFPEHFPERKQTPEKQIFSCKSFAFANILRWRIFYVETNGAIHTLQDKNNLGWTPTNLLQRKVHVGCNPMTVFLVFGSGKPTNQ